MTTKTSTPTTHQGKSMYLSPAVDKAVTRPTQWDDTHPVLTRVTPVVVPYSRGGIVTAGAQAQPCRRQQAKPHSPCDRGVRLLFAHGLYVSARSANSISRAASRRASLGVRRILAPPSSTTGVRDEMSTNTVPPLRNVQNSPPPAGMMYSLKVSASKRYVVT